MKAARPIAAAPAASEQATFPLDAQAMAVAPFAHGVHQAERRRAVLVRSRRRPGLVLQHQARQPELLPQPPRGHQRCPADLEWVVRPPSTGSSRRQRQIPSPGLGRGRDQLRTVVVGLRLSRHATLPRQPPPVPAIAGASAAGSRRLGKVQVGWTTGPGPLEIEQRGKLAVVRGGLPALRAQQPQRALLVWPCATRIASPISGPRPTPCLQWA